MATTVTVSYELGKTGKRRSKTFDDANAAKMFYTAKDKAGCSPKVVAKAEAKKPIKALATKTPATDQHQPTAPGVSYTRTRPYVAGQVIGKYGLGAGVTQQHVDALNEAYGQANDRESFFALRNAWHAARGYAEANA